MEIKEQAMEKEDVTSWILVFKAAAKLRDYATATTGGLNESITVRQERVLGVLFCHYPDGVMMKDIAKQLHITPGAASKTVDALVHEGLVERCFSENDRRAITVRPTEKSREFRELNYDNFNKLMQKLLDGTTEEERKGFKKILQVLIDNVSFTSQESSRIRNIEMIMSTMEKQ